jgi:hypothetical protein
MCVLALGGVTVLGYLVSVAGERKWQGGWWYCTSAVVPGSYRSGQA